MVQLFRKNVKGFTTIELVVVISTIVLLTLLATPKILGYTRDAKVSSLHTDTEIISNAAHLFNVDSRDDLWPFDNGVDYIDPSDLPIGLLTSMREMGFKDDDDLYNKIIRFEPHATKEAGILHKYITHLKNPIEDYILVVSGQIEGEVFHFPDISTGKPIGQLAGDRLTTWYNSKASITLVNINGSIDDPDDYDLINGK